MPELKDLPVDRCPPELHEGEAWLRDRLEEAGVAYTEDDGSGFVLQDAGARVWVTGNLEDDPLLESAFRRMAPAFSGDETTIYGRPTWGGTSFLYWRAGGVDSAIECDVNLGDVPPRLVDSIRDLIKAQRAHPYG